MHDPWIDRLSDHIDGLLSDADRRELEAHLDGCAECRSVDVQLRAVVSAAHDAPALEPERDLWPGIEARLVAFDSGRAATGRAGAEPDHAHRFAALQARRRFSFSMPQLAAAAVVLMAVSGAAVWMIADQGGVPAVASGTIIQSAGEQARSTRTVSTQPPLPQYPDEIVGLERALEQNRAQLDPATVDVIERSLEAIDRAVADARSALAADPGNPYLHRQLDNTMRKKIDILRRATGAQRARS